VAQTNREVLKALRAKLGDVSHQAISQRRARIQKLVPMPVDIATYIVAQAEGVRIEKWLDADTLATVAEFQGRLAALGGDGAVTPAPKSKASGTRTQVVKELRVGDVRIPKDALSQKHMDDAERMSRVYPLLYAFENSMREFIDGHLTAVYGDKWWDDPKIVNTTIRKREVRNRNAAARHRYHSRRTDRAIYYTDLGDLPDIATSENGWKVLKSLLPSDKWLYGRVEVIEASRNVVAHMNPLRKQDIDRIRINFEDWLEQVKGARPSMP
jgi:Swt1-like HEPN